MGRAPTEKHLWRPSANMMEVEVSKVPGKINPLLIIVKNNGEVFELEVSTLDLETLRDAVEILTQIKNDGK